MDFDIIERLKASA